jgi:Uma2 family endonuclease
MQPPSKYHGIVCGNVAGLLRDFAIQTRKGYLVGTNESGLLVESDPDTARGPNVSFYEDDQTAGTRDRTSTMPAPRLAVEVLSPGVNHTQLTKRVLQFLARGVAAVWVIDPETRSVAVDHPSGLPRLLDEADELDGHDALPGFRCRVAAFFALPGKPL